MGWVCWHERVEILVLVSRLNGPVFEGVKCLGQPF